MLGVACVHIRATFIGFTCLTKIRKMQINERHSISIVVNTTAKDSQYIPLLPQCPYRDENKDKGSIIMS